MNDDLQSYIEPELEARIVALVLGEASAFEAEEVERLIEERPELRAYRERIEKTHSLVGEAFAEKDNTDWQLSEERWQKVSSKIEEQKRRQEAHRARQRQKQIARQKLVYACAACLVIAMVIFVLGGASYTMGTVGESSASYEAKSEPQMSREEAMARFEGELQQQRDLVADHREDLNLFVRQYGFDDFDETASNPLGATEQELFTNARRNLAKLEVKRDALEEKIAKGGGVTDRPDGLSTELESLETRIDRVSQLAENRKNDTVELSLQQNHYNQAKETYEQSRNMLREMEIKVAEAVERLPGAESRSLASVKESVPQKSKKQSVSDALATLDEQIASNDKGLGFDLPDDVLLFDWKVSSEEAKDRLWHNQGQPKNDAWSKFIDGGISTDSVLAKDHVDEFFVAGNESRKAGGGLDFTAAGRESATASGEGEYFRYSQNESGFRWSPRESEQDESRKTALGLETMDPASQPKGAELHWNFEDARQDSKSVAVSGIVTGGTRSTRSRESKRQSSDSEELSKGGYAFWDDSKNQNRYFGKTKVIEEEAPRWRVEPLPPTEDVEIVSRGSIQPKSEAILAKKVVRSEVAWKPAAPSISLGKVIAANTALPATIPVPAPIAPDSSVELGDDFGDGWGEEKSTNGRILTERSNKKTDNFSSLEEFHKMTGTTATALANNRDGGLQKNLSAYLTADPEPFKLKGRGIRSQTGENALFGDEMQLDLQQVESIPFYSKDGISGAAAKSTTAKLNQIIIPELNLENTTVEEALEFIQLRSIELDSTTLDDGTKGVEFSVRQPAVASADEDEEYDDENGFGAPADPSATTIKKLNLKNVPAKVALDYIAQAAKLRYKVGDDGKVTLLPLGDGADSDIVQRRWTVPSDFGTFLSTSGGGGVGDDDPFADETEEGTGGIKPREDITTLLKQNGVSFPEGTTASYLAESNSLIIRNSATNLELIDGIVGAFSKDQEASPADDLGVRSLRSMGRQIVLPEIDFQNTTVREALQSLRELATKHDQMTLVDSLKGVNIIADQEIQLGRVLPDVKMQNVPLLDALEKIGELTGTTVGIDEFAFRLSKTPQTDVVDLGGDGEADQTTRAKSRQIIVPEIELNNATLEEALEFIRLRGIELDSMTFDQNQKGFEIAVSDPAVEKKILEGRRIPELKLKNVPILVAIEEIARQTGCKVRIENGKIIFFSDPARVSTELSEGFETFTAEKSDSTFSLNVSDVSFKLAKAALAEGSWPDASKVRAEEFVNALDYDDSKPSQEEKVACVIEQGAHPFMQQRNLMRIAMSTASLGRNASTPLRLTILLDQSGSMERADRVESVQRAFALLTAQLQPNDEVSLIGFARTPRLLAERLKGDQSAQLARIVANPLSEGGTNLEAALSSGLQIAKQQFVEGAQNRIILLTDGAANLGDALPENLARQVEMMRKNDIAFDACGVGADGLNDEILSSLAKQGDGRYYFLDRPEDADDGFAKQIAGALRPAAKNVKVQILFNPERVSKFKLYGFEKHKLKKEDFRNDAVDAAEMAAEESGIALYHFETLSEGRGDIGTVSVRFLDTASKQMVERTWAIPYQEDAALFSKAKPTLRLAGIAGLFAEKLKGTPVGERVDLKRLRQETELLKPTFDHQPRFQELKQMLQQAGQ